MRCILFVIMTLGVCLAVEPQMLFSPEMPFEASQQQDDFPELYLDPAVFTGETLTIEAWIAPADTNREGARTEDTYRSIVNQGDLGRNAVDFYFQYVEMVPIFLFINPKTKAFEGCYRYYHDMHTGEFGKNLVPLNTLPHLEARRWNHVVGVFDNGRMAVYLNGAEVASCTTYATKLPLASNRKAKIGGMDGAIGKIAFYTEALTESQVKELFDSGRAKFPDSYVEYKDHRREKMLADYSKNFEDKLPLTREYEKTPPEPLSEENTAFDVVMHNGAPALMHGAELIPLIFPTTTIMNAENPNGQFDAIRDWAAAGFGITGVCVTTFGAPEITDFEREFVMDGWFVAPGQYDFSVIDAYMHRIIRQNPRTRLFVRLHASMPRWWCNSHKNEAGCTEDGKNDHFQPSFSSPSWRRDCPAMLHDIVEHIEQSDYGYRVMGYLVGGGRCTEWYWFGTHYGPTDYSECNQNAFRKWLAEKYQTDDNLRKHWKMDDVTLDTASVPSTARRAGTSEMGMFRYWPKARDVIDYRMFEDDTVYSGIDMVTKAVKNALRVNKPVGLFYGYTLWHEELESQGFRALGRVLDNSNVDFIMSPVTYDRRQPGMEGDYLSGYGASLALHRKLYLDEADFRTCFSKGNEQYKTYTYQGTIDVSWRTLGNALTSGSGIQYLLLAGVESWHHQGLMEHLSHVRRIMEDTMDASRKSIAEVALIMDEAGLVLVNDRKPMSYDFQRNVKAELGHAGIPYDTYLFSDLFNEDMPDYKLYIFPNLWTLGVNEMEVLAGIHAKLSKNNAAAIWFYAPGYFTYDGINQELTEKLTGFSLERINGSQALPLTVTVQNELTAYMKNDPETYSFDPMFAVRNGDSCASFGDNPAIAQLKGPWGGLSIYSQLRPTADLLRGAARAAGCHIWNETGDLIRANEGFLMIHATGQGNREIRLPRVLVLENLIDNTVLKTDCISIPDMHNGQTVIWRIN